MHSILIKKQLDIDCANKYGKSSPAFLCFCVVFLPLNEMKCSSPAFSREKNHGKAEGTLITSNAFVLLAV